MEMSEYPSKPLRYQSYIVRCWQERSVHAGTEIVAWRFNLQNPRTSQRHGYATLEALLISLQEELTDEDIDVGAKESDKDEYTSI